jgi:transcriptional regulator with XRE-family HTH domain
MNIADRIRQLRESRELPQRDLAKRLGIGQTAVSNWETGINGPTLKQCRKICEVFSIRLSDFFKEVD